MRRKELFFNILFWVLYFLYEWLGNAAVADEYCRYLVNASVIVPTTLAASLFTVHVLVKKLYMRDKKQLFWIGLILSMFVFVMIRRSFNYYYTYPTYYPDAQSTMPFLFWPKMLIEGVYIYLYVALYAMFYFIKAWYEQQRLAQTLQQDKVQTELELLKSQVHPHFIFNTLNNIYSLSLRQHPQTPDLIYRLSSFLDYNLYDSKTAHIPLTKELDYIYNYIELEKIRFGDRLDVSINVYDSLEGFTICPLLLMPLIENCFKHGSDAGTKTAWIRMDITTQKDWVTIKLENSICCEAKKDQSRKGIGIENVRRRLEILFPGKHEFSMFSENHSYLVILKLKSYSHENKVPAG
jgi:two-component system, LytTR family, sensor kinase